MPQTACRNFFATRPHRREFLGIGAAYPAENPTHPADLAATIYHVLGVDPHMLVPDRPGRPMALCEGTPIDLLL